MVQENSINNKIIIICGATASGKTDLAIQCAKLLNSEVISADSMYVYKWLDVGTAKPTTEEMDGVLHHMIDVVSPTNNFTVSDYKTLAEPILQGLLDKGKIPIICGGTGFYVNSLLYDLSYGNGEGNLEVRNKYKELAFKFGNKYVYDILMKKDPLSAERLHYNDLKRVIRALEICESGVKKSDIVDELVPKYNYKAYCIDHPREILYQRINKRVDIMINNGLIDEVKGLLNNGVSVNSQCMQGIGYKEVVEYINGDCDLNTVIEKIKLNTRHYAKRQITFFKRLDGLTFLEPATSKELAKRIISEL